MITGAIPFRKQHDKPIKTYADYKKSNRQTHIPKPNDKPN